MTAIWYRRIYELLMLILASISVGTIWYGGWANNGWMIWGIWFVFFTDISIRAWRARHTWRYLLKNPFDVVSVIPLDSTFLFARFARFIRLFRMKYILKRYARPLRVLAGKTSLTVYFSTVGTIIVSAVVVISMIGDFTWFYSAEWVLMNVLFFNYEENMESAFHLGIAIMLKIQGLLTYGLVISRVMNRLDPHVEWVKEYPHRRWLQ